MPKTAKKKHEKKRGRGDWCMDVMLPFLFLHIFWRKKKKFTVNLVEVGQRGKKVLI